MTKTRGGRYYVRDARGRLVEIPPGFDEPPEVVICRRVADFPGNLLPAGCVVIACTRCQSPIVQNPAGPHQDRPRICMQCAGIDPLPVNSP